MSLVVWDEPVKHVPLDEWEALSADGAPPGVYTRRWKDTQVWYGKVGGTRKPPMFVTLRYTTSNYVYVKVVVSETGTVNVSMNGTAEMTRNEFIDMGVAISEAFEKIAREKPSEHALV